jgi:hypothetical protein
VASVRRTSRSSVSQGTSGWASAMLWSPVDRQHERSLHSCCQSTGDAAGRALPRAGVAQLPR